MKRVALIQALEEVVVPDIAREYRVAGNPSND
jgi:hypothetical protein